MDEERRIRFLVAPLLMLLSFAWAVILDPGWDPGWRLPTFVQGLTLEPITKLIAILAAGGALIFVFGLLIGTVTHVSLRALSSLYGWLRGGSRNHEARLSQKTLERIWLHLSAPGEAKQSQQLFAAASFDHGLLRSKKEGVHRWIMRRWNAFSIGSSSASALFWSWAIGHFAGIHFAFWWWVPVVIVFVSFVLSAFWAWRDVMDMLRFEADLPL